MPYSCGVVLPTDRVMAYRNQALVAVQAMDQGMVERSPICFALEVRSQCREDWLGVAVNGNGVVMAFRQNEARVQTMLQVRNDNPVRLDPVACFDGVQTANQNAIEGFPLRIKIEGALQLFEQDVNVFIQIEGCTLVVAFSPG